MSDRPISEIILAAALSALIAVGATNYITHRACDRYYYEHPVRPLQNFLVDCAKQPCRFSGVTTTMTGVSAVVPFGFECCIADCGKKQMEKP